MAEDFLKLTKSPISASTFAASDPKFLRRYTGLKGALPKKRPNKIVSKFKNMIVIEDNTKWNKLLVKVEKIQKDEFMGVDVGLFDPISQKIISYGVKNELGIQRPQRSYIAITFDMNKNKMLKMFKDALDKHFFKEKRALAQLEPIGKFLQREIKQFMYGTYWLLRKPNTPRTVRKKGFNHPLIESHNLVNSIITRHATGKSGK